MRKMTERDKRTFSKLFSDKEFSLDCRLGMLYALSVLGYVTPESMLILKDNLEFHEELNISRETYKMLLDLER